MNDLGPIVSRLAKTTWVVLYRTKPSPRHPTGQLTLLLEPGTSKVWSIQNDRIAKYHAKENNGMAATWEDAWRLLVKEYGDLSRLEDELMQRILSAQDDKSKLSRRATDVPGIPNAGQFDDNANPNL